jgi:hypothetical protein
MHARASVSFACAAVAASFAALGACSSTTTVIAAGEDAGVASDAASDRRARESGVSVPNVTGPRLLSETGLYSNFAARTLAPGVMPFAPRYSFWSDGAEKSRFLLLPPGTKIDTSDMDDWAFPVGTKVWKELKVGGKVVETRMLWKQQDAGYEGWWMVAYVWRADGTDAEAKPDGVEGVSGTTHDVPSQEGCVKCHMGVRDVVIGVSAIQLSSEGGDGTLTKLANEGRLSNPPGREFQVPGTGVVKDTLAYLHANCSHCHNGRQRVLANQSPIRLQVRTTDTAPEQTLLYTTTINTKMKHEMPGGVDTAVVPRQPDKSELWLRIRSRDLWAMPPLATKQVDPASDVVRQWILGLP